MIQDWRRGASEWEQSLDSCDINASHPDYTTTAHHFFTFWGRLGRVQNKTTSIPPLVPFPFPSLRILRTEKSSRNGSDTADTLSGTSAGKQTQEGREGGEALKINLFFLSFFLRSSPSA